MIENCDEQIWDDLSAIEVIPLGAASFALPMQVCSSVISTDVMTIDESRVLQVPTYPGSIKASENVKDNVSGRSRNVSVTFNPFLLSRDVLQELDRICHEPHHLRLTFWNGTQAVVRATRDSYTFTHAHGEDGHEACSFNIHNVSGIQFIL